MVGRPHGRSFFPDSFPLLMAGETAQPDPGRCLPVGSEERPRRGERGECDEKMAAIHWTDQESIVHFVAADRAQSTAVLHTHLGRYFAFRIGIKSRIFVA
jgi:hypothetical protein